MQSTMRSGCSHYEAAQQCSRGHNQLLWQPVHRRAVASALHAGQILPRQACQVSLHSMCVCWCRICCSWHLQGRVVQGQCVQAAANQLQITCPSKTLRLSMCSFSRSSRHVQLCHWYRCADCAWVWGVARKSVLVFPPQGQPVPG